MQMVVATHGHCFDGLASAVLFTRLLAGLGAGERRFAYRACGYGAGQQHPDDKLLGDGESAILDYRFFPGKNLTWYFDHHRTAFLTDDDRRLFESRRASGRYFYDAECSSCTKLIARVAEECFDVRDERLDELVDWADRIDAARFESAEQAVSRSEPVMRMVSVVEHYGDDRFLARFVPELLEKPLIDVAASRRIDELYGPLGEKQGRFVQRVRAHAEQVGRIVFVDLTDAVLESVGKFVTYALFPESTYSVIVGRLKNSVKISVGYNPWSGRERDKDISAICARWGGGGHPVVGGISFKPDEVERARGIAREIADELGS
jgi:hypothetical protein